MKGLYLITTLAVFLVSAPAIAGPIVNVNARNTTPTNPSSILLDAGTYQLVPVGPVDGGVFTASNVWSTIFGDPLVDGCNPSGKNCAHGWQWRVNLYSDEIGELALSSSGIYRTAQLALASADSPAGEFSVAQAAGVNFFFPDSDYSDNHGGVSFSIEFVPNQVPAPGTAFLLTFGALGLVALRRNLSRTTTTQ
ncbi:MAG: hypothetical protein K9J80_16905 [Sulfuritalea sp.]|nr:hypothetical protein [Sulfuritalea sp.]